MEELLLHYYIFRDIYSLHNVIRHNNNTEMTILNPSLLIIAFLSTRFKSATNAGNKGSRMVWKSIGRLHKITVTCVFGSNFPPHTHLIAHQLSCQVCYIPLMASLTISKTMPHKTIWTGTSLVAEGDSFWCDKNKSQGQSLSLFKSIRFLQR